MAKKKLTPEEEAAKKAAAKPAPAKPSAQQMSGGAVKPSAKPDAAAKGAAKMQGYVDPNAGTKAAGQTASEAKAAFRGARDTRFTMPGYEAAPGEPAPIGSKPRISDPVPSPNAASAANAAEAGAAKMSQAAEAVPRGGRIVKALTSPVGLGTSALVADALIPRSDDSTDAGYNLNTARDMASGGIGLGMFGPMVSRAVPYLANKAVPKLAQGPLPAKLTAAALAALGAGSAAYNRSSDYYAANPEADNRDYELPKAEGNLWSQAPAALSDAGRVASQILRGVGDGTSYLLNNYTPYPYLRQGYDAVVDYITPPSMKGGEASQPVAAETPTQPVPQTPSGPLPENTERTADGRFEQKLYGPDGTFYGQATGSLEQMDRLAAPSEMELQQRARQQVEDNIQQRLFAERVQKEREFRERTSPEAAQRFFDRVNSERALRDAMNRGRSSDPARNAMLIQDIQNAATNAAEATGKSIEEILPEDSSSSNVRLAREILRNNPNMGLNEIGLQGLGLAPARPVNYSGDDVSYADEQARTSGARLATAASASNRAETQQRLAEESARAAQSESEKLELRRESSARADETLELRKQQAQMAQENSVLRQIERSRGQIAKFATQLADPLLLPEAKQALQEQMNQAQGALNAGYARAQELGLDLGEAAPEEQSASPAAILANLQKLSPQDLEALSWANSNPDDPRSQDIKNKIQAKLGS